MAEIFTWRPRKEAQGTVKFRTLDVQFGDGYKQSAGDGINTRVQSWDLTFIGKWTEISEIVAFLDARQGFEPFLWTPKSRSQALFEVKEYRYFENGNDIWTLTATFNQRF